MFRILKAKYISTNLDVPISIASTHINRQHVSLVTMFSHYRFIQRKDDWGLRFHLTTPSKTSTIFGSGKSEELYIDVYYNNKQEAEEELKEFINGDSSKKL